MQDGQIDHLQRPLVRGRKGDRGMHASFDQLQPAARANTPTIARLESRKMKLRPWCGEIISGLATGVQELFGDFDADRVATLIRLAGITVAVAKESGDRCRRT